MNERTNEELVALAIDNNQEAIAELYNRTYAQGFAVALQMVKNEQEAMDIMQEAYVSAFRNLRKLNEAKKFKSWFNCIVANKCRDYLRKHKEIVFTDLKVEEDIEFEDTLESDTIEFSPEASVDYSETKRLMNEILQGLPQEQRLCILMFYYNELSVKEIAESLKCSENTVKSRLNYARRKIKDDVKALEMKGTKLYNVAPIPFIIWMLHSGESEKVSGTVGTQLWGAVQQGMGKHFLGKSLSTKVLKTVAEIGTKKVIALTIGVVSTVAVAGTAVVVGITGNDNRASQIESVNGTESDEETISDTTAPVVKLKDKVFTISDFAQLTEEVLVDTVSDESEYNMSFVGYEKVAGLDAANDEYIATLKESINEEPSIENLVVDIPTEEGVYRSVISFKDQYKNEALVEVYIVYDVQDPVEQNTVQANTQVTYTYTYFTGEKIESYLRAVYKDSTNVYDSPSSSGNVIETFSYKHAMYAIGICNETGWYIIEYDDSLCGSDNYQKHVGMGYSRQTCPPQSAYLDLYLQDYPPESLKRGYINPNDVMHPSEWEDEIYHVWNGIEFYEWYNISQAQFDYYKSLCYSEYYTIVEMEGQVGMIIPDPDEGGTYMGEIYQRYHEILEQYVKEKGYTPNGGGGSWLSDDEVKAYHVYVTYTTEPQQSEEIRW